MVSSDQRKQVAIDGNVAIINGDRDRMRRRNSSFPKIMVDEFSEGDHSIAIVPEIFQMGFEKGCGHGHTVGRHRTKAMIKENGNLQGSPGWQQP
jgi:hypothetical protein